jgi:hypothetical protein
MIRATNYGPTRFCGWWRSTCSNWPTHAAGVPTDVQTRDRCRRVVFGPLLGDRREVDLLLDLGPGESVDVDLMTTRAEQFAMPAFDPAGYGVPAILCRTGSGDGVTFPLAFLSAEIAGAKIRCTFRGRFDELTCADVWVDFVPGQGWAVWEAMITAANPLVPETQWFASVRVDGKPVPSDILLTWMHVEGAVVFRSGMKAPATLLRAGETMAHGQARAFVGVIGWQPFADADRDAGYCAALQAIVAVEVDQLAPIGLPLPAPGKRFGALIQWGSRLLKPTRDTLDGYDPCPLGPAPNSSVTGAQEDQGYAHGGECAEPGNLLPSFFSALGLARRPCHWIEPNGELLEPDQHKQLVFWSGQPHWHRGVSPDQLGLPRLPSSLETCGWYGPDREHWFSNRLWFALASTASPALYRLAEHQAQLFCFGETVEPGWSTSGAGTARGVGWTALVAANLLRLLRAGRLRDRFVKRLLERIERVIVPTLQPASLETIPVMHRHPGTDLRSGISPAFPAWWQTWQQAVGAFGLWMLAEQREVRAHGWGATADTLQTMALAFARGVTDYATTDEPNGDLKTWDNVGLRSDGQPLWPDQWRQGVGATCSGMFRHWAQPLAWWVVARGSQDARARDHYERLRGEAMASASTCLAWMPPL